VIAVLVSMLFGISGMEEAAHAFQAGLYEDARVRFETALAEPDMPKGALLYNLGNCAFRMGLFSEAVLFYKRALLRLPRDKEVKFNLGLAEQRLGIDPSSHETFGAAVEALADSFTPQEMLILTGGLQVIGLVGLVLLRRGGAARNFMVLLVLLALAGAARLVHTQWMDRSFTGVVLAREIALR